MVLGVALAVTLAATEPDSRAAWLASLTPSGWLYATAADDVAMFFRPPTSAGAYRRIWIRWEEENDVGGAYHWYRSAGQLQEHDCAQGRYRTLQWQSYPQPNLGGNTVDSSSAVGDWQYPMPGTLAEMAHQMACAKPAS